MSASAVRLVLVLLGLAIVWAAVLVDHLADEPVGGSLINAGLGTAILLSLLTFPFASRPGGRGGHRSNPEGPSSEP